MGDLGSIPGLGRKLEEDLGNPLQYFCLENPHGQRSLAGYSSQGHKESNTTDQLSAYTYTHTHTHTHTPKKPQDCWRGSSRLIFGVWLLLSPSYFCTLGPPPHVTLPWCGLPDSVLRGFSEPLFSCFEDLCLRS